MRPFETRSVQAGPSPHCDKYHKMTLNESGMTFVKSGVNAARHDPVPGFSLKYFSNLPVSRSKAAASAGGEPLTVMLGQIRA